MNMVNKSLENGEPNIEKLLFDMGFIATDKIIVNDDKGKTIRYIKVLTPSGYRAFVDPDINGEIITNGNEKIMSETQNVSSIPYSIKNGSLECASNMVCGVAYECSDEICVLRNSITRGPEEIVFTTEPEVTKIGSMEYVSYPIVKLSEILEDSQQVNLNIEEVSNRLQSEERQKCIEISKMTNQQFGMMANAYNEMVSRYQLAFQVVNDNLELFNQLRNERGPDPIILEYITRYYDLQNGLFKQCEQLIQFQRTFENLTMDIQDINRFLKASYSERFIPIEN